VLGVLDDRHPNLQAYLSRIEARPAFQRATAD
jgi:glutathione S-transferase